MKDMVADVCGIMDKGVLKEILYITCNKTCIEQLLAMFENSL